ncbi:MAG: hypothetical protein K2P93_06490 [Alphaproteobacteria bacterium]|nr:hypothetical protein [Alphaproteobacteria bacterium]
MKIFKKSLLVSTMVLWGVSGAWGMDEQDNKQAPKKIPATLKALSIEKGMLDPLRYVLQFTIPADEAAKLLLPHWKHNYKGNLLKKIKEDSRSTLSRSPLKALIEKKKSNKAL